MNHAEFLKSVLSTANEKTGFAEKILGATLGLTGESGEVADIVKKVHFHGHELDRDKLKLELGDVFYYLYRLCYLYNFEVGDVLQANSDKLKKRYSNGFSSEASKNRSE